MKKTNYVGIVLGLLFLVIGLGYLAEVLGIIDDFTIFFDGWWTLFIIIPCFLGLISRDGEKVGYLIGIAVGGFLLLSAQDVIDSGKVWALLLALICVLIGVSLMLPKKNRVRHHHKEEEKVDRFDQGSYSDYQSEHADGIVIDEDAVESDASSETSSNPDYESRQTAEGEKIFCSAVFSGRDIRVDNSGFYGADLSALFGGIDLNLKNAIIRGNVTIDLRAVFGGIDILMPPNVRVVVEVTPILGGVDNGTRTPLGADESTPTVFIKGTCLFGGVDVK